MMVLPVVLPVVHNLPHVIKTCNPTSNTFTHEIPVVDLSDHTHPDKNIIVNACKEFGFFKVINHGISFNFLSNLEDEVVNFFKLPLKTKEKAGPPNPFGYGNKNIGHNVDVGWLEYLLLSTNPELISQSAKGIIPAIQESLWCLVNDYVSEIKKMTCRVLEMIADELQLEAKDELSKLIRDEKSDSCFRLNNYPTCRDHEEMSSGRSLIGFGEHTDPQIMSVLRSNDVSGFQICLKDGAWVSVPPDPTSFYLNVGDCLQVMTNGRFRSVKHRVLASDNNMKSRVSMIYFGGPPLTEKITPLREVMEEGEESLYKEYTWSDYKKSAYETKLSDNRGPKQVMTNGRFRSVKHRVLAGDNLKSRVSMIYFGGPPLTEKITPLREVMEEGEESLYKEFTVGIQEVSLQD